ncbi:hypothetical protein F5Y11DRAFT_346215 [Daldinia sp. FL1419]|nr:hypothetical protein F5Y11DRAFT_346215 [Daldinia sp. FL1419]
MDNGTPSHLTGVALLPFFGLPAELRDMVWTYAFDATGTVTLSHTLIMNRTQWSEQAGFSIGYHPIHQNPLETSLARIASVMNLAVTFKIFEPSEINEARQQMLLGFKNLRKLYIDTSGASKTDLSIGQHHIYTTIRKR